MSNIKIYIILFIIISKIFGIASEMELSNYLVKNENAKFKVI